MTIYHGDCIEVLKTLPDCSVDAVVTDPPYGLNFMGKAWDYDVPSEEIWRECLRVLKPGGHLLAFAGTRTQHRMAVAIEDAGFEIRDMIAWVYGSGFPKSHDVSKAIDKAAGAEREKIGSNPNWRNDEVTASWRKQEGRSDRGNVKSKYLTSPATDAAKQWHGWGTALKPALEPITVARKPFPGTVAENVLAWGTGAINVDGCRVEGPGGVKWETPRGGIWSTDSDATAKLVQNEQGRWPANLIHDGSEEVVRLFPETGPSSQRQGARTGKGVGTEGAYAGQLDVTMGHDDAGGSAARFFYCAKASKRDRDEGLQNPPQLFIQFQTGNGGSGKPSSLSEGRNTQYRNHHPTVKPTDLMRYLVRLVTPPGGVVLDPFMGSGSTGKACALEGFGFIGIEREAEYVEIARARIAAVSPEPVASVAPTRHAPTPKKPAPAGQLSLFGDEEYSLSRKD